jgi:prepilin-type processing-associated H-X9-DG protein
VAIAIITVLAAALLPVLSRARESSRRSACVSNMRQIGIALLQYAQDNDESGPVSTVSFRPRRRATPVTFLLGSGWAGRVYPYLRSADIFYCPSDPTTPAVDSTGAKVYPISYALNRNLRIPPGLAAIPAPSRTVLLCEVTSARAELLRADENMAALSAGDALSPAADGTAYGLDAFTATSTEIAGAVRYATGEIDNQDPAYVGWGGYKGASPRHFDGANYLAADGHASFLLPQAVSAGANAISSSGRQSLTGCYAGPAAPHAWLCAEGTAVGTHSLTFSIQ